MAYSDAEGASAHGSCRDVATAPVPERHSRGRARSPLAFASAIQALAVSPDFYQVSAHLGLLDEGEGVAEVGRERVFGGEGVLAGAGSGWCGSGGRCGRIS